MKFFKKITIAVLIIASFVSCDNSKVSNDDSVRAASFDTTEAIERDELVFLSLSQNYKLNDKQINHDLESFLSAKNCENTSNLNQLQLLYTKSSNSSEKRYEIEKKKTFSRQFSTGNIFANNKKLQTKSVDGKDQDSITFSIYNFADSETGKKGFAITSDDERIGSLLCVIEDCEYSEDVKNPLLDIFLSHLDYYVENVRNEWESITEADYEMFKQKYGITDEDIEKARLEYENSLKTKKFWGYSDWSEWSVNDINLNNFKSKTKWGQGAGYYSPYNDAIKAVYGKNYLTGCGATAVAQIIAYHKWPERYSKNLDFLKSKWTTAKNNNWNGIYDWDAMLSNPNANFVSINGKIGIGALLYETAEEMNSQYYINEYGQASTSTYLTDALRCFRARGYLCDDISRYSFDKISSSLNKDRPVYVFGNNGKSGNSYSGHFWIIDGSLELKRSRNYYVFWIPFPCDEYQSYVHCNFGWSGFDDKGTAYDYCGTGYYKSGVFATTNYDFSNNLQVITNIRPNR